MHVLNLTTNADARFYRLQVRALEESYGVTSTTLSVPGKHRAGSPRTAADYLRFFPQVVRESLGEYDLIHANYGLTAPMALSQPKLPVVLSLWGSDLEGSYRPVSRASARFCDAVIVMSEEMEQSLGQDCTVIPHGVDLERFQPTSVSEARAELGWDDDSYHVLFPYSPERTVKDYPRAERVVEAVREQVSKPVELHTISGLPHPRVAVYMNASDSLLLTSKREGSPNVVKESLACNLPVVATRVGDVPERLAEVDPSYVCDSDDELIENLVRVLQQGGRSNGRKEAERVGIAQMADHIYEVYEDVLAKNGRKVAQTA
ncbi:glycosyl transferase [Haloprofundus marisrubri]|uniref:Glycosyl transferase n=1 Tax=Haloprofundus marisrubri TaxID=1514971 RepID=A0A0W1R3J6_9EURY|nr:glycosyltransferase [Haloprofundus marisrubri]KTG07830.1 glycosyl transferase [Haloprofundus marisrubri]